MVFEFIDCFYQIDVVFLNQVEELQIVVGVFFGDRDNQMQVCFNYFFFCMMGFCFVDGYVMVDIFNLFDGQVGFFFNLLQFLQVVLYIFFYFQQFFRLWFVYCYCGVESGFVGFVVGEQGDEVFFWYFVLFNVQFYDDMFLSMNVIYYVVYVVDQVIELFWYQVELFEDFRQFQDFFLGGGMVMIFGFDGVVCQFVLGMQFGEFFMGQFWVDVVVVIVVVVGVFIFVFVVIYFFLRQFGVNVGGGWCYIFFGVWIDEIGDQIGQMGFFCFNVVVLFKQVGDCFWIFGNGVLYLIDVVFDVFGDVNFVFMGQQFYGIYFMYVYMYWVGCVFDFGFYVGEYLCGGFGSIFICGVFGKYQIIGIWCFFYYLNIYVVDYLDDVFDLIGIDDIFWQMVIDFGIGQIVLFFIMLDKKFQL